MGITDYGHRGVPNVLLAAPLNQRRHLELGAFQEQGLRRAGLAIRRRALDLGSQRAAAGKIQTLLLDETPVIFSYFYDFLTATAKSVSGRETTAMAHVFLAQAMFH